MTKHTFIYVGILAFITLACGSTTPLATPEPASVEQTSPTPEQIISPAETPEAEPENGTGTDISVPGLRVFYVREGNLWLWTEAGGASQLTDAGIYQLCLFRRMGSTWLSCADVKSGQSAWMARMRVC